MVPLMVALLMVVLVMVLVRQISPQVVTFFAAGEVSFLAAGAAVFRLRRNLPQVDSAAGQMRAF